MNRKLIIVFLISLVLLVSACANIPGLPFNKDKEVTGGQGLRMSFAPGAPRTDKIIISDDSRFVVRVKIENYGEEISGTLDIWDNLPGEHFSGSTTNIPVELGGADVREDQRTGQITAVFPEIFFSETYEGSISPDEVAPDTKLNVFAELSIPNYHVTLEPTICLKRENDPDPSCSNKEVISSVQMGPQARYAPVVVQNLEKIATYLDEGKYFVDLKLTLRNVGGGEISQDGQQGQVMNAPSVSLKSGRGNFRCSPNILVFENNEATLNCIHPGLEAGESAISYPLSVDYGFGYKLRIKAGPIPLVKFGEN